MSKYIQVMSATILLLVNTFSWAGKAPANKAPTVSLTAPVNGASFSAPATITLSATASDTDGTISKVEFYRGTTLIGTATSAPYGVTWNSVPLGTYSLTAKATDNAGAATTSSAVSITVTGSGTGPNPINSPVNGAVVYGGSVSVSGTFTGDPATTTVLVDNGNTTRLATLNNNNFTATLPLYIGSNTLTASVIRRDKTSDTGSVTVTGNDVPKVAFKSPTTTVLDAPASVAFEADAVSPAGTISKVEFFRNGQLLGTANTSPYQYTWSSPPAGNHVLQATATDNNGQVASATRSLTVNAPNVLPAVSLVSPANGAVFTAPANVVFNANANDSDGSIVQVEFIQNGLVLGATNVAPHSFNWTGVPAGGYTLSAKATDNRGGSAVSAPVSITVSPPNSPPVITLTSPAAGATFVAPAAIGLSADAVDSDGTIAKVEFFQGSTLIGTATSAPYTLSWTNVPAGSYNLTAKASDNVGAVTVSAPLSVTVNANSLPTISLSSPAAGTSPFAPAKIVLTAAASDSDGTIAKVEFFEGTTLLGTVTSAPYTLNWANVAAGSYSVTAKATDDLGGTTESTPLSLTVITPAFVINAPTDGATIAGNTVLVSGTINAPSNSGIKVNGQIAAIDTDGMFYAHVPLTTGANTISVTITTLQGQKTTQSTTVNSNGTTSPILISVDRLQGLVPMTAKFSLRNTGEVDSTVQFNGNMFTVPAGTTIPVSLGVQSPGAHPVTIIATDSQGGTITRNYVVVGHDAAQTDQMFKSIWNGMNNALVASDNEAALQYLNPLARAKYGPVFDTLRAEMPDIVASYSQPKAGRISSEFAEYVVNRVIDGINHVFFLYFLKDVDGVWRIDSM